MDFKQLAKENLVDFIFGKYRLKEIIGHGKIGVVFKADRKLTDSSSDEVAIKVIPPERLRNKPNWEDEIVKLNQIKGNVRIPRYIDHGTDHKNNLFFAFIVYEYIPSVNLREWLKSNKVSMPFVEGMVLEILEVFHSMKVVGVRHNDLHAGNILVTRSEQEIESDRDHFYVTDFGIGGSANDLIPKDDSLGLAEIINLVLEKFDFPDLSSRDRTKFEKLTAFFKDLTEKDPTVGSFVREPKQLLMNLKDSLRNPIQQTQSVREELSDPFEYLSCEQIGNSFRLLTKLYSSDFLGRNDLLERNNTIFTGPRGCGKTTVFRNLSDRVSLIAETGDVREFVGIYYQCLDLFFAFPYLYLEKDLKEVGLKVTAAYFNLALLHEVLETLSTIRTYQPTRVGDGGLGSFLSTMKSMLSDPSFSFPKQSDSLDALLTWVSSKKKELRGARLKSEVVPNTYGLENMDFLKSVSEMLQQKISYFGGKPVFFFIDDYSNPKVPIILQKSLNQIIFQRNPECFFKISTESITSIYPEDASGKVLELSREYDVIDLGSYFFTAEKEIKTEFLSAIVNNRLNLCSAIQDKDISVILGSNRMPDTEIADRLRKAYRKGDKVRTSKKLKYHGLEVFVDLCSGEVGLMLRMLKEMFINAKTKGIGSDERIRFKKLPIDKSIQDKQIRETGNDFLVKIEAAPETGSAMRKIVEAFAEVSRYAMIHTSSKNQLTRPPKLATKIELRDSPGFEPPYDSLRRIYDDLIRYAVFLRDVRGKSIRGSVVPRLFLRRLLIPTFNLTFSKRDNIGIEVKDFYLLLSDPRKFVKGMKDKIATESQETLFSSSDLN